MTVARHLTKATATLVFALSLAGCGNGGSGSETTEKSDARNQVDGVLAIDKGNEGLLGSINLPRPDWMPNDMPLPKDAHIYLATHIRRGDEPDLFMLQAKSFIDASAYAKTFYAWAESKNLRPELTDKPGVKTKLVGFTGAGESTAMTQVISRDGYRDIAITFAGPL